MFLYDWNKIFEYSKGSPTAVYLIFKMLVTHQIPKNKYDKIYRFYSVDFSGASYLVHPDVLIFYSYKHSYREIAQYLALASLRPLADYLATGETSLDLYLCDIDESLFKNNSLLRIEDNRLHFLYEEVNKEKLH